MLWTKCLCPCPNSCVEAPTFNVMVFEDLAFGRCLGLDEATRAGIHDGIIALRRRDIRELVPTLSFPPCACTRTHTHTKRLCEHTARWQLSSSQKKSLLQNPTLLAPWSQTSSLQKCEKINFCHLSHTVYGILLWQPKLKNPICNNSTINTP